MPAFSSAEHEFIGNTIDIPGLNSDIELSSGAKIKLGTLIALAGDYYGIPGSPIALGKNDESKRKRFLKAFNTLDTEEPANIKKIADMIAKERANIEVALKEGRLEREALDSNNVSETIQSIVHTNANYVPLAENNIDHFAETALIAYKTGHRIALDTALYARVVKDSAEQKKLLNRAFAIEGFACHFLTDLFAAGHMRTPRLELHRRFGTQIGALLSLFQHEEDGEAGLTVTNKFGKTWKAYGDGHFFDADSADNRAYAQAAVKCAINEVYQTFEHGNDFTPEISVFDLIPNISTGNHSALFRMEGDKLMYRRKLGDIQSAEYREMSNIKLIKVLSHFALHFIKTGDLDNIVDQIRTEKPIKDITGLPNFSIFHHAKPMNEKDHAAENDQGAHHCACQLL